MDGKKPGMFEEAASAVLDKRREQDTVIPLDDGREKLERAVAFVREAEPETLAQIMLRLQEQEHKRMSGQLSQTGPGPNFGELKNRFTYHPPTPEMVPVFQMIREAALNFAVLMDEKAPFSRELSLAQTKLEEVVMWVNAAIARNGLRK